MVENAGIFLVPLKQTYAVKGRPAIFGQEFQAALDADPCGVLLEADFHNAFNTISCSSTKQALIDNCTFVV
jgi:hypothetical protein